MTITINGNWVNAVKDSIPDHSVDVAINLVSVIEYSPFTPVDTHAIAYVAALASSNGGLAFEIEHNSPLFHDEKVREAAKTAASLTGIDNILYPYIAMIDEDEFSALSIGLSAESYKSNGGISKKQFAMYSLASSIVGKCELCVKTHYNVLKKEGVTLKELQHIGKIAAVINAIGKIAL